MEHIRQSYFFHGYKCIEWEHRKHTKITSCKTAMDAIKNIKQPEMYSLRSSFSLVRGSPFWGWKNLSWDWMISEGKAIWKSSEKHLKSDNILRIIANKEIIRRQYNRCKKHGCACGSDVAKTHSEIYICMYVYRGEWGLIRSLDPRALQ